MLTVQLGQGNIPNPNQELDLNQKLATDAPNSPVCLAPIANFLLSSVMCFRRSKERPHNARHADSVGGGDDDIEDPRNEDRAAVGRQRCEAEAEHDEKCRQRHDVYRRQSGSFRDPAGKEQSEKQHDKQENGRRWKQAHKQVSGGGGDTAGDVAHDKSVGRPVAGSRRLLKDGDGRHDHDDADRRSAEHE